MKKGRVFLFCLVVFIGLFATAVSAESYECTVISAGPSGNSKVLIHLFYDDGQGGTFSKRCVAKEGREKEMLAVALTAMANGLMVGVSISNISAGQPEIKAIYLLNQQVP